MMALATICRDTLTLIQVMTGVGSPWALHGIWTSVPDSTVASLGAFVKTGVTDDLKTCVNDYARAWSRIVYRRLFFFFLNTWQTSESMTHTQGSAFIIWPKVVKAPKSWSLDRCLICKTLMVFTNVRKITVISCIVYSSTIIPCLK